MAIHTRLRIAAAIGALVAPLAVVTTTAMPADAGTQKHKHQVEMYKVERNIRLAGVGSDTSADSGSQTLRCNAGDLVLDGMWSVKHVDQYNPPPPDPDDDAGPGYPTTTTLGGDYNDERDVWVQASYPEQSDFRSWNFELENKAYGDAQVKLFLTCIRGYTEYAQSHHHQIKVRNLFGGGIGTTPYPGWLTTRFYVDSTAPALALPSCSTDEFFVAPGFDTLTPDYRLVGTYPAVGSAGRGWTWEFGTSSTSSVPPSINIYGRCIDRRVFDGASPRHAIAMRHLPSLNVLSGHESHISIGDAQEVRYSCDQDDGDYHAYKAMVGWFWMGDYWYDNWYLGMEPRPKTRAYTFWNWNGNQAQVRYGDLCINSRTTNPLV